MKLIVKGFKCFCYAAGIFVAIGLVVGIIGHFAPEEKFVMVNPLEPKVEHSEVAPDPARDPLASIKDHRIRSVIKDMMEGKDADISAIYSIIKDPDAYTEMMTLGMENLSDEEVRVRTRREIAGLQQNSDYIGEVLDLAERSTGDTRRMYARIVERHLAIARGQKRVAEAFIAEGNRRVLNLRKEVEIMKSIRSDISA